MKIPNRLITAIVSLTVLLSLACNLPTLPGLGGPKLGETYRSARGGFSFSKIPNYAFDESFGIISMTAPGGNRDTGPTFSLLGGINEKETTNEEQMTKLKSESKTAKFNDQKAITVDGKKGYSILVADVQKGKPVKGRIALVMVTPTQTFLLYGYSPEDAWNKENMDGLFNAVLGTVKFFPPEKTPTPTTRPPAGTPTRVPTKP